MLELDGSFCPSPSIFPVDDIVLFRINTGHPLPNEPVIGSIVSGLKFCCPADDWQSSEVMTNSSHLSQFSHSVTISVLLCEMSIFSRLFTVLGSIFWICSCGLPVLSAANFHAIKAITRVVGCPFLDSFCHKRWFVSGMSWVEIVATATEQ